MPDQSTETRQAIDAFGEQYGYDVTYMHNLLAASPEGYRLFEKVLPMAAYRNRLDPEVYCIARMTAMQSEDCGPCLQLAVDMAKEQGVPTDLLRAVLDKNVPLDKPYEDIRQFALSVAMNTPIDPEAKARIHERYGDEGIAELALCIASSRIFPTIKRATGHAKSCLLIKVEAGTR